MSDSYRCNHLPRSVEKNKAKKKKKEKKKKEEEEEEEEKLSGILADVTGYLDVDELALVEEVLVSLVLKVVYCGLRAI